MNSNTEDQAAKSASTPDKDCCRLLTRTESLEKQAAELLQEAKQDTCFAGKVDDKWLAQFTRLGEQKRKALLLRIDFVAIKREIKQCEYAGEDGKLFADLLSASGLEDRLDLLDEEIEISEEIYGECVERLSDFDYFWREYWAEIWIIVILIVELVEFFYEIYLQLPKS